MQPPTPLTLRLGTAGLDNFCLNLADLKSNAACPFIALFMSRPIPNFKALNCNLN